MAGLIKEAWLSVIMAQYEQSYDWMNEIGNDLSSLVHENFINLAEAGVDPEVLVNNTTYPIPVRDREDSALRLPLDYFDTENTRVTAVEQKQLAYDKMASVTRGHARSLRRKTAGKASHAIAPTENGEFTPVLATTGGDNGASERLITEDDLFILAERFDEVDAPDDRTLVLHAKHWNELVRTSETLKEQRFRQQAGTMSRAVLELAGFRIYRFRGDARYVRATGVKKAWNAAPEATDGVASFAFVNSEIMKAVGTVDMFYEPAATNPRDRADIMGFQQYFLAMPMRPKYTGAIFTAAV